MGQGFPAWREEAPGGGSPRVRASFHLEAWQLSLHPTNEARDPGKDSYSPKIFHPPQAISGRSVTQTGVSSVRLKGWLN